ncbi:MAG TPA: histidine phosphatase family protein [Telluria sp.]
MELILWRHADAENSEPDLERVLTARGRHQAQQVADWLNVRLPPNTRILCSPAVRAQQTLEPLQRDFDVLDSLGTGAEPAAVLQAAGWPARHGTVLVVGHQPTLGRLASLLLCGRAQGLDVRRGACWWFEQSDPHDSDTLALKAVVTPELVLK